MIRRVAVLVALLLGLTIWERALASGEAEARSESVRVGRLISMEERDRISGRIAAVEVRVGEQSWLYFPYLGMWRCPAYRMAPALASGVEGLLEKLTEAEGVVQSEDPALFSRYGIGTPATTTVTLHGPEFTRNEGGQLRVVGDPLLQVEIGLPVPGRDGCFARLAGEDEVWSVDASPLDLLTPPASGQPPLLDPHLVATGWPGEADRGVVQVVLESKGEVFEFTSRDVEITPEEAQAGAVPFEWTLLRDGVPEPTHSMLAAFYSSFLLRATWLDLVDPSTAAAHGFGTPAAATVTIVPRSGEPLQLQLAPPRADGSGVVLNPHTGCLYLVDPEVRALLVPDPSWLSPTAGENHWDEYLRRQAGR